MKHPDQENVKRDHGVPYGVSKLFQEGPKGKLKRQKP